MFFKCTPDQRMSYVRTRINSQLSYYGGGRTVCSRYGRPRVMLANIRHAQDMFNRFSGSLAIRVSLMSCLLLEH